MHAPRQFYWPAIFIGVIVAAYWGRVLRLVYKSYKKTGRAANLWPAETLGRALRIVWIPAVIGWIVAPLIIGIRPPVALKYRCLSLLWNIPILNWTAVVIAVITFALTLICWKKMGKSWRMGIDPNEKTQLVVSGPYAYVRHPIYALQQVLAIASAIAVPTVAMFIVAGIVLIFLQWEARREERYLVQNHGEAYAIYLKSVGRFIPRFF